MNFDFSDAAKAKETGSRLEPGIKEATFKGVSFDSITKQDTGDTYNVMSLKLDVEGYGEYTQNFFEPTSKERATNAWGGTTPSSEDHFKITLMQILMAVAPDVVKQINSGELKMQGNFKAIVKFMKDNTDDKIGTKVQIKLIPNNKGFASMPAFPAKISASGDLNIANKIIGQNLTLTPSELKKIQAANAAKPTQMKNISEDVLADAKDALNSDDDSDLPF